MVCLPWKESSANNTPHGCSLCANRRGKGTCGGKGTWRAKVDSSYPAITFLKIARSTSAGLGRIPRRYLSYKLQERKKGETRRGDCLSSLYLFSNILPFVSIVHLWSDSPRGRSSRDVSFFLLFYLLLTFFLTAVRFHRVAAKRRRLCLSLSLSLFFCFILLLTLPFHFTSAVVPLADMIYKVCVSACVWKERERTIEKYRCDVSLSSHF